MKQLFFIIFFIASCTPQKKLDRLLNKYPELYSTNKTDTMIIFKTSGSDTIFKFDYLKQDPDTFRIFETKTTVIRNKDLINVIQVPQFDTVRVTKTETIISPDPYTFKFNLKQILTFAGLILYSFFILYLWKILQRK